MTRKQFTEHIASLDDFGLYMIARNMLLNRMAGSHNLLWKFDALIDESGSRDADIYKLATTDASAMFMARQVQSTEAVVRDIIRPSLMQKIDFDRLRKSEFEAPQLFDNPETALNQIFGGSGRDSFICRVSGDSMIGENIFDNDVLLVDTSDRDVTGRIIVASVNGTLFVKKYVSVGGRAYLQSANEKYKPVPVDELPDFKIIGAVKTVLHSLN